MSIWFTFGNDIHADGDALGAHFASYEDSFPVVLGQVNSYSSCIIWDEGLPYEALRGTIRGLDSRTGGFEPPTLPGFEWDTFVATSLDRPRYRTYATHAAPSGNRQNLNLAAPMKWGGQNVVAFPDMTNEEVVFVTTEGGPGGDEWEEVASVAMPYSGLVPVGVAGGPGTFLLPESFDKVYTNLFILVKDTNRGDEAVLLRGSTSGAIYEAARDGDVEDPGRLWMYGIHAYWTAREGAKNVLQHWDPLGVGNLNPGGSSRIDTAIIGDSTDPVNDGCLANPRQDISPPSAPTWFGAVETSATGGEIRRIDGYWDGKLNNYTVAVQSPPTGVADPPRCILLYGTSLLVLASDSTTVSWALYDQDVVEATSADALLTGSYVAGNQLLEASCCTDGRFVYGMLSDGHVFFLDPITGTATQFEPRDGFATACVKGSNVVFTGRGLMAHAAVAGSDGQSCFFRPL